MDRRTALERQNKTHAGVCIRTLPIYEMRTAPDQPTYRLSWEAGRHLCSCWETRGLTCCLLDRPFRSPLAYLQPQPCVLHLMPLCQEPTSWRCEHAAMVLHHQVPAGANHAPFWSQTQDAFKKAARTTAEKLRPQRRLHGPPAHGPLRNNTRTSITCRGIQNGRHRWRRGEQSLHPHPLPLLNLAELESLFVFFLLRSWKCGVRAMK